MKSPDPGKHTAFGDIKGRPQPVKPQEKSLKRHGDDLQSAVDKATGRDNKPH